jgi:FkbM family methyltransferase
MIVQTTMVRNELPLIKELLPIWKEYADGFVFLCDTCTDETVKYLNKVKHKFNILEIIESIEDIDQLKVETDMRQHLFDAARKYSNKIICLDADEYLDGTMSKQDLENLLDVSENTVFHLKWIQYTSKTSIRIDGPWAENYKDRITLIEGAVCDYDGDITFFPINKDETKTTWVDGNPGASSLFKSNGKYTVEHYVQYEIKTKCHRLDTIMKLHNIPKVDIIWMDLQGAELLAFKGLGEFVKDVKYIHTEVTHKEMYSGQVMFKEFNDFMTKTNKFILKNNLSMRGWQEDAIYQQQ